jgi:hypothetical protein
MPACGSQNKLASCPKVIRRLLFVKKVRRVSVSFIVKFLVLFRRASLFDGFVKFCVFNVSHVISNHDIIMSLTGNSSWQQTNGALLPEVNY